MSIQEMVRTSPETMASVEQSLALVANDTEIVLLNPELWEPKTFETKVRAPFEKAEQAKSTFEAISAALGEAADTARESYANPDDLDAAFATRLGEQSQESKKTASDRLIDAALAFREGVQSRKSLLQTKLLVGATGVSHEAEQALALITEVQGGTLVTAADREFKARERAADTSVARAGHTLLETLATTSNKTEELNTINDVRREIQPRYQQLCAKLATIVNQDQEATLLTNLQIATTDHHRLLALKQAAEINMRRIDTRIALLAEHDPTPRETDDSLFNDEFESFESPEDGANDPIDALQTITEAQQLRQELAAQLADYDIQLADQQEALRGINEKLSYIRELAGEERDLYRIIIDNLAPRLITAITPGVQQVIDSHKNKATLEKIDGIYRQYIEAELWLADQFEPLLTRQPNQMDSLPAGQETVLADTITAEQALEFLKKVGVIIVNREKIMTTETIRTSQDHTMQVGAITQETYLKSRIATREQALQVAAWGYAESDEREKIGEKTDTIRLAAQEALLQLNELTVALDAAMSKEAFALETYDALKAKASDLCATIEATREKQLTAQEARRSYEASIEEARAVLDEIAKRRKLSRENRAAGLVDEETTDESDLRARGIAAENQLSRDTLLAEQSADKAELIGNQLDWELNEHDKATNKVAAQLNNWVNETRKAITDVMEQGAHCGEDAIALIYELTAETIEDHSKLTIPTGHKKKDASKRVLADYGQAPQSMQELLGGSEKKPVTLRDRAALAVTAFRQAWRDTN